MTERVTSQSLLVSNEASRDFTPGDLLNLMSVDVDNVFECAQFFTASWGGCLRILSSLLIIWWYLGPSCFAGLLVIVACVPLTACTSSAGARYQVSKLLPFYILSRRRIALRDFGTPCRRRKKRSGCGGPLSKHRPLTRRHRRIVGNTKDNSASRMTLHYLPL